MIVKEDGWLVVNFEDWTPTMMALSYVLAKLPVRPDMPAAYVHSYPVGIEKLRSIGGDAAVEAFYEVARDLEFRPDYYEVVELGKGGIEVQRELLSVVRGSNEHRLPRLQRGAPPSGG